MDLCGSGWWKFAVIGIDQYAVALIEKKLLKIS